jgi:hypothetical protein
MVSLIVSIAANRGFELQSAQTKDCKIGLYCVSVLYATLRSKIKDLLVRNQYNVSEWSEKSPR